MKRFWALTQAMFLVHIRERASLFWNFAFPIFLLIIYGAIFGGDDVGQFMSWTMPGVVATNLLAFGLIGSSTLMVEMRGKGVLRRLQASPVPTLQLLGSYLLVNVLIGLVQSVVVITFAVLVYGVDLQVLGVVRALLMIMVAVIMAVALGQVVSGFAPSAGAAVAFGQVLYFGQMFICDLIMPIDMMPAWIQRVAPYLPGYTFAQLVRPPLQTGEFGDNLAMNLLMALLFTVGAAALAAVTFRWETQNQ